MSEEVRSHLEYLKQRKEQFQRKSRDHALSPEDHSKFLGCVEAYDLLISQIEKQLKHDLEGES